MSAQKKTFPISMMILGCVALAGAVSRCSPISPSTSKLRQSRSFSPLPLTADPFADRSIVTPIQLDLLDVPASVLAFNDYHSDIAALVEKQTITLSADTFPAEFDSLKKNRAIMLHVAGKVTGGCKGYLEVTLSDRAIEDAGLNLLSTRCTQVSDIDWLFAISPKVADAAWSQTVNSLQSATISVSNASEISVSSVMLNQLESTKISSGL